MRTRKIRLSFVVLAMLVTAAVAASATARHSQQTGPVYNLEGAWYGVATIAGLGEIPSLDTFTSNARNPRAEGSGLCTIPVASRMAHPGHPGDPNYWLSFTASAHLNWVRTGTNAYAFTAVRTVFDQDGALFGWMRHWGTISPTSDNQYTGTGKVQSYTLDGTPVYPQNFTSTLHSNRIEVVIPEE